jgi:hypothetical protein
VLRELESIAPPAAARSITSLSEYRQRVAGGVEPFMVQLPICTVKPLYVLLVAAVVRLGENSIAAPFEVSAVAYGCFAVLLLIALAGVTSLPVALMTGFALLLSPPFLEVGRLAAPDALSACIVFGGFYALVFADRPLTGAALLLLSIAARPDNVIFCLAIAGWWGWKERHQIRYAALGGAVSALLYLVLGRMTGGYSWSVLFTHSFLRRLSDLESVKSDVTLSNYLATLLPGLRGENVLNPSIVLLFVVVSALGWVSVRRSPHPEVGRTALGLQLAIWLAAALHFVAHPMLADRFFVVHYACLTTLTVSLVQSGWEPDI